MKNDAQVHVLEVIIVAGMLFTALYFIQGISTSTYTSVYEPNQLRLRADTALMVLDNKPDSNYDTELTGLYIEYKDETENRGDAFSNAIYSKISPCYGFSVNVYDITKMYRDSSADPEDYQDLFLEQWAPKVGSKTSSSRLIVDQGNLYEFVMELWYL